MSASLIAPHGGHLSTLYAESQRIEEAKEAAREYPSWDLSARQLCDLELLMNGGFSPLSGFLNETEYRSVLEDLTLPTKVFWPLPITLDLSEPFVESVSLGDKIALRDPEGVLLAILTLDSLWSPDKSEEAARLFGTTDEQHLGVDTLLNHTHPIYAGGEIEGIEPPPHYDHRALRHTPKQLREHLAALNVDSIAAFATDAPMHQLEVAQTRKATTDAGMHLLIHASVGAIAGEKYDRFTRVRCYRHILSEYPENSVTLSLLSYAPRFASGREMLCRALVAQNFGANFFLCEPHYTAPKAQEALISQGATQMDINHVSAPQLAYSQTDDAYVPVGSRDNEIAMRTEDERQAILVANEPVPSWFSYPQVITELRHIWPPRAQQGFTVFFTGLSGSGKSTIANALVVCLLERGGRNVTLLDGDLVRKHLSSELGFSKAHRNINIERIGYVASEITKNGGIAVCAPIAPYAATRRSVRQMIEAYGGFIEAYVATPIEVCEARDRKGLYAKARAGLIKEFTGIDDPYDVPINPEIVLDTQTMSPETAAQQVFDQLQRWGYL